MRKYGSLKTYINGLGTDNLIAYDIQEPDLTYTEREELTFCNERVLPYTSQFNEYGHTTITNRCDTLSSSGSIIGENRYYYHTNHLGSVEGITDSSGNVVSEYDYDTFGKASLSSGFETGNTRLYTGREFDEETQLYYNRARYYAPSLGRFISRDPIGIEDDINLYSYVANNPVMYIDLFGTVKLFVKNIDTINELKYKRFWNEEAQGKYEKAIEEAKNFHHSRNQFNKLVFNINLVKNSNWEELPWYKSVFHKILATSNQKFVSQDGHIEIVFDGNGNIVLDQTNLGTYNFFDPQTEPGKHSTYDVWPYLWWGN